MLIKLFSFVGRKIATHRTRSRKKPWFSCLSEQGHIIRNSVVYFNDEYKNNLINIRFYFKLAEKVMELNISDHLFHFECLIFQIRQVFEASIL